MRHFAPSVIRPLLQHPARQLFDDAVLNDATLRLLFTERGPDGTALAQFMSSTGRGGGIHLMMFGALLIRQAWATVAVASSEARPN